MSAPGIRRTLRSSLLWAALVAGGACNPNTARPPQLVPVTGAFRIDVALTPDRATQELADQLVLDSVPVTVVVPRDGYLESPWFEAASGTATDRWPLGPEIVRLRAWIDPGAPRTSHVMVELVFRPLADPSLPARELDQQVPPDHPASQRVQRSLDALSARYGVRTGG